MEKEVFVYVDLNGSPILAGRLWSRMRRGRESATFEYDRTWLQHPNHFALEPALQLVAGPHHTPQKKTTFGAIGDSAPDRWGRMLLRRATRRRAESEKQTPRGMMEIDYLLSVNDYARQGALRFTDEEGGQFLSDDSANKIPPLVELPRLLSATEDVLNDTDTNEDLRLLLAPGSSLGGARPKASIIDRDGRLTIAKFPHTEDEYNSVLWEALALTLASQAKITVPNWKIEMIAGKPVLLLRRFDRHAKGRTPFLSAMSMLGASDNEQRSYLDIADALRQYGVKPKEDITNLWRRMVFNIMISNTDDHLRNHGFLYSGTGGWQLSPAYDLNPVPADIKPRILTTAIDFEDGTASLDLALSVAEYFQLELSEAQKIAHEVAVAVSNWRQQAKKLGIANSDIKRMASAFEHTDLTQALSMK